jgi:predicted RNA-binding Zn-ribbon protein involved in translation (DUF1610 family)
MTQAKEILKEKPTQPCPQCGTRIGVVAGSKDAICSNCGFKDPCCE